MSIPLDILDDVCSRFIVNLPDSERNDPIRICFQMEQAHWFYLDFYCVPTNPHCQQIGVREFIRIAFKHCPFLADYSSQVDDIINEWRAYKAQVPTYGAILLDSLHENILLVQGFYAKSSWGFPKGKVNQDEPPHECAIREVKEETGFDISSLIDPENFLERYQNESLVRLYIISNVPMDFNFHANTRNEIKQIKWFKLLDLPANRGDYSKGALGFYPNHFYTVVPFVSPIQEYILEHRAAKAVGKRKQKQKKDTAEPYYQILQHSRTSGMGDLQPSKTWQSFRIDWGPIIKNL